MSHGRARFVLSGNRGRADQIGIKAGVDGMSIHKAITELFDGRGFPTEVRNGRRVGFFHGTGHGLGLEIHEYPRLQKVVLKAGQCLTVEPGLYYPGIGGARIRSESKRAWTE